MKIQEMSMESRPREKALRFGFGILSDLELVAILLGSGSHNRSVFDIAQDLLDKSDNLANLYGMKVEDLTSISGIREARALKILSGIELCKRALRTQVYRTRITHPDQLIGWFEMEYGWLDREHFVAVFLDTKGNILSHRILFIGTLNESTIHPRDIFKEAFVKNAYSFILISPFLHIRFQYLDGKFYHRLFSSDRQHGFGKCPTVCRLVVVCRHSVDDGLNVGFGFTHLLPYRIRKVNLLRDIVFKFAADCREQQVLLLRHGQSRGMDTKHQLVRVYTLQKEGHALVGLQPQRQHHRTVFPIAFQRRNLGLGLHHQLCHINSTYGHHDSRCENTYS